MRDVGILCWSSWRCANNMDEANMLHLHVERHTCTDIHNQGSLESILDSLKNKILYTVLIARVTPKVQ